MPLFHTGRVEWAHTHTNGHALQAKTVKNENQLMVFILKHTHSRTVFSHTGKHANGLTLSIFPGKLNADIVQLCNRHARLSCSTTGES